jgi:hypothetical protein
VLGILVSLLQEASFPSQPELARELELELAQVFHLLEVE